MKRIGIVLIMAIVAIALIAPAGMAQSMQTVSINGYVYSGALPIDGAKVQLYSWDGKNMGNSPLKTVTTSDGSSGITGSFVFKNVPYDSSKTFNYVIKAEKNDRTAYAFVHIVPAEKSGESPKAEPVVMDLAMDSWVSDLTGTVQSGNLLSNAIGVQGANVSIYERNQTDGSVLANMVAHATTDSNGKFEIKDLGYGLYQAVVIAKVSNNNYEERVNFTVYQQETHINAIMTQILLATPTPTVTPTPKPSGGSGGFFGIPGFEALLVLLAIPGAAFLLSRKK